MRTTGAAAEETIDAKIAEAEEAYQEYEAYKAKVAQAKQNLEYTHINAPLGGRTGKRLIDPGDLISANNEILTVIHQMTPMAVRFSLPEKRLPLVREYQKQGPLRVEVAHAGLDAPLVGRLTFIDNQVDRKTGMFDLEGTFANKGHDLWPGQFVTATLTVTVEKDRVLVPYRAVENGPKGRFVFVVDGRTVKATPVKLGRRVGDHYVVDEGLTGDEAVVVDGQLRLTDGAQVKVVQGDDSESGR
jgi:multidrug efflux system membrane fusion protein